MNKTEENKDKNPSTGDKKSFPGYPPYPKSEDIYAAADKVGEIDGGEDVNLKSSPNKGSKKGYKDEIMGEGLDVPGADLDDAEEAIGSEDEENNYYSLGGDNHEASEEENTDVVD